MMPLIYSDKKFDEYKYNDYLSFKERWQGKKSGSRIKETYPFLVGETVCF